jgi:hypothetical protein
VAVLEGVAEIAAVELDVGADAGEVEVHPTSAAASASRYARVLISMDTDRAPMEFAAN